jgi:hypothetical protein
MQFIRLRQERRLFMCFNAVNKSQFSCSSIFLLRALHFGLCFFQEHLHGKWFQKFVIDHLRMNVTNKWILRRSQYSDNKRVTAEIFFFKPFGFFSRMTTELAH